MGVSLGEVAQWMTSRKENLSDSQVLVNSLRISTCYRGDSHKGAEGVGSMRRYTDVSITELSGELAAGLVRLRRGYIDAAESLMQIVEPDQEYPFEFVVSRLTGYRPPKSEKASHTITGKGLLADMQMLMFDICDSVDLKVSDYGEGVYDTATLARKYNVSTKTVQRWRKRGLPARRLVFPDGKRRVAFLKTSVDTFTDHHKNEIDRSVRFTQMSAEEREEIIRQSKRMAQFTNCCLSDVAKRLANKTGRAVETIRYTIRNHDVEHPDDAVFPYLLTPLDEKERLAIYRSFLRGVPVMSLAEKYHRTRGSIYRVVNEMRARQLMKRPIDFIDSDEFAREDADALVLGDMPSILSKEDSPNRRKSKNSVAPNGLPAYLRSLYDVPLLNAEQERHLFRQYNYLKFKADKLRDDLDVERISASQLRKIEGLLVRANAVKNQIIRSNLRLVVSIAKKHAGGAQTLFELISDGNVSLMRAVEKFDYSRGYRFSTYASWAIMRNYARSVPKERYQLDRFSTGHESVLDIAASLRAYDPNIANVKELRESIDSMLSQLSSTERSILIDHYGLDDNGDTKTLDQLGQRLGISKERVRQIEIQALKKLRAVTNPDEAGILG